MPLTARQDEIMWPSEPDRGTGSESVHRVHDGHGSAPHPASPAVSGSAMGSDAGIANEKKPKHDVEPIMLRKTGWLMLRSTAHNLNNVLRNAGVSGVRVRQLYSLEVDPDWGRVRCLIALFKWAPDRGDGIKWNPERTPSGYAVPGDIEDDSLHFPLGREEIMFCSQAMDNASATQAVIMSVMNIPEEPHGEEDDSSLPFLLGEELSKLKTYMKPLDPTLRTAAISSSQIVRDAHNQAARDQPGGHPDLLDEDGRLHNISLADELWMYSAFVPGKGERWVYELHGVADMPQRAGFCDSFNTEKWTSIAFDNLEQKVTTFQEHNTPYLLFAVTSDTKQHSLPSVPRKKKTIPSGPGFVEDSDNVAMSSGDVKENSSSGNVNSSSQDSDRLEHSEDIDDEIDREEVERIRATHNYDTFFIEMMKLMASRGDLNELIRNYPEMPVVSSDEE